jgi:hypothetical protein
MRHLALAWPDDPRATERDDEYLFGPSLLAAPVLAPGATRRAAYLPAGRWIDLWRSVSLGRRGEPVLGAARVLGGARDVTVPAPRDELPLFVRAGALIPLLDPDVQTLTGYGTGVVHLADRAGRMSLVGWPVRGESRTSLGPGESARVRIGRSLVLRIHGHRTRRYAVQLSLAAAPRRVRPCRHAAYDPRTRVLRFRWRTRSGRVVLAAARCRSAAVTRSPSAR